MHYSGSFEVDSPKDKAYAFFTDPAKIIMIFPDVQDAKISDSKNFSLKTKVGLEFVKGWMDVRCVIAEKTQGSFVKLRVDGRGLSSAVELENGFSLENTATGGTLVRWSADAKVSGLMARIGSSVMDSVAERYINEIIGSLKEKLSGTHAHASAMN